ncbi:MAG TPA: hypothetical protein VN132_12200 [Bdellovibrio sp.]|nr:hypothetical protein [Bdellovibrio sp.]
MAKIICSLFFLVGSIALGETSNSATDFWARATAKAETITQNAIMLNGSSEKDCFALGKLYGEANVLGELLSSQIKFWQLNGVNPENLYLQASVIQRYSSSNLQDCTEAKKYSTQFEVDMKALVTVLNKTIPVK